MPIRKSPGWKLPLLAVLLTAGCGSGELVTAGGQVTLDGEPLPGVVVEFQPAAAGGTAAFGLTDASGRYSLMRTAFQSGVAPGKYLVRVYVPCEDDSAAWCGAGCELAPLPAGYRFPTDLRATVEPRGRQRFDFDFPSPQVSASRAPLSP